MVMLAEQGFKSAPFLQFGRMTCAKQTANGNRLARGCEPWRSESSLPNKRGEMWPCEGEELGLLSELT
jgi:hypothetical protein